MGKQISDWVENIVGKGEIAPMHIFSFSNNVFKSCLLLMDQNEYLWTKGLTSLSYFSNVFQTKSNKTKTDIILWSILKLKILKGCQVSMTMTLTHPYEPFRCAKSFWNSSVNMEVLVHTNPTNKRKHAHTPKDFVTIVPLSLQAGSMRKPRLHRT